METTTTKVLEFFGSSDDNFSLDIDGKPVEEVSAYETFGTYKVSLPDGSGWYVTGYYSPPPAENGCWLVGMSPIHEEGYAPQFPVTIEQDDYTPRLALTVPSDAVVSVWREIDEESPRKEWVAI